MPHAVEISSAAQNLTVNENWISIFFGLNRGLISPAFIVNIDQNNFQELIESPLFDEGQETAVIDSNGIVVSHSEYNFINYNKRDRDEVRKELFTSILNTMDQSGSFTKRINGIEYLVSYERSNSLGWIFIGICNKEKLLYSYNQTQNVMLALSIVFTLISLIVSFFVSKRIYTPLYELTKTINKIKNENDIDLSMRVYDNLRESYMNLVQNINRLESSLSQFTEMKAKAVADTEAKKAEWVRLAVEYIDTNYSNVNLTVELISDYIGLSPNYLRTIFKNAKDISISKYIQDTRITQVKNMLLNTEFHVYEIAEKAGFSNAKHFYVIFKQYTGLTCEQFRKNGGDL
jgi:AraC-like DNA-binding protein